MARQPTAKGADSAGLNGCSSDSQTMRETQHNMTTPLAFTRASQRLLASTVLASLTFLSAEALAKPLPFRAEYGVHYLRIRAAEVVLTLEQQDNNWSMHRSSRAAGLASLFAKDKIKIDEQSRFKIENQQIKSEQFTLNKPGDKRGRRHLNIQFSDDGALVRTDSGDEHKYAVSNSYDQLSAVLAVMLRVQQQLDENTQADFELSIMERRGEDKALFKVIDRVTVETPAGTFKTIHLEQKTDKRTTDYWLAIEHNMVPVKIRHQESGEESAEMKLEKLSLSRP